MNTDLDVFTNENVDTAMAGDAEKARTGKARTENAAPKCRGGNRENGKVGK